jgi:hypothetical protein
LIATTLDLRVTSSSRLRTGGRIGIWHPASSPQAQLLRSRLFPFSLRERQYHAGGATPNAPHP